MRPRFGAFAGPYIAALNFNSLDRRWRKFDNNVHNAVAGAQGASCSMLLTPPRGNLPLRGVVESAAAVSCRAECQSERRAPSCTRAPAGVPRWRRTLRQSSACATPSTCRCSGASPRGTTKRRGSTRFEPQIMRGPLPSGPVITLAGGARRTSRRGGSALKSREHSTAGLWTAATALCRRLDRSWTRPSTTSKGGLSSKRVCTASLGGSAPAEAGGIGVRPIRGRMLQPGAEAWTSRRPRASPIRL